MQSKVAVRMAGLLFPSQCAACGAEGAVPIRIAKAFLRGDDDEGSREEVLQFEVKLCASCAIRHQSEKRERSLFDWLRQAFSDPGTALGASIVGGVGCLFLVEALKKASLAVLLFSLLPLLIAYYLFRVSWNKQASKFLPPPTTVSSCVDFSDFQHRQYEPVWLHFYFSSPSYAEAFRQLNASRLWDPGGGEAVAARQKRAWMEKRNRWLGWALGILLLGFGLLSWLLGWDS